MRAKIAPIKAGKKPTMPNQSLASKGLSPKESSRFEIAFPNQKKDGSPSNKNQTLGGLFCTDWLTEIKGS
tara:strand:+ start:191 stop:400 length:210 start_codon:yes stop_codon:yes gene_type:complete